jgi:L-histidine N-alpha-methyltransferase
MRLQAQEACRARIGALNLEVDFLAGEEMRTEISAKFTPARIADNLTAAGLEIDRIYTDTDDLFALTLARPGP